MPLVQVSPGHYVEVSTQALDRARNAFAQVAITPEQAQKIEQAAEAVAHVTVLAGNRLTLIKPCGILDVSKAKE